MAVASHAQLAHLLEFLTADEQFEWLGRYQTSLTLLQLTLHALQLLAHQFFYLLQIHGDNAASCRSTLSNAQPAQIKIAKKNAKTKKVLHRK